MRKLIAALAAGLATACGNPPPLLDAQDANQRAVQLAQQGDYAAAIRLWEPWLARQPSAALFGNLGYAYYLAGQHERALWALEKACVLAPADPLAWERLAALLETMGQGLRAVDAMRQARELRERQAALAPPPAPAAAPMRPWPAAPAADLWPADMARTEVRQVSAGLVEVVLAPRQRPAGAAALPAGGAARVAGAARARPPALEISNGNGVRGLAAAWSRRLQAAGLPAARLTNTRPFQVQRTRIEVKDSGDPLLEPIARRLGVQVVRAELAATASQQLRIVLGKDLAPQIKKPPAVGRRQAP